MGSRYRHIPKGCPILGGSPKVKMIKASFVRICKNKQLGKGAKKAFGISSGISMYTLSACERCPIKHEVNSGEFRRPIQGQLEFWHPYEIIQQIKQINKRITNERIEIRRPS